MNKNKITILVIFILTLIASWLFYNNRTGTIKEELRDFAVKDTASINKIFMADANGKKVTLEKTGIRSWQVNRQYEARMDAIDVLLQTIYLLELKSPVSKASFDQVVKNIAGKSTKVEIYQGGNKPVKTYFVGGATPDNSGTYMLLENSSAPFIIHIPGFTGYLTTRYFTDQEGWRSTDLFKYNIAEVKSVEVTYAEKPEDSFIIENISNGKLSLRSTYYGQPIANFDTTALVEYLMNYQKINFEFIVNDIPPATLDSIVTHCKKFTITVTDDSGNKKMVNAFKKPVPEGTLNMNNELIHFDQDRMYALINNDKDVVIIQHFVFDKLTPPLSYFETDPIVKK